MNIITVLNYPKYSSVTSHLSVREGGKGLKDFGGSHGFEAKWRWGGGGCQLSLTEVRGGL